MSALYPNFGVLNLVGIHLSRCRLLRTSDISLAEPLSVFLLWAFASPTRQPIKTETNLEAPWGSLFSIRAYHRPGDSWVYCYTSWSLGMTTEPQMAYYSQCRMVELHTSIRISSERTENCIHKVNRPLAWPKDDPVAPHNHEPVNFCVI